jgi:DNA invertase Pin-like site-specific DNA recombinase
MNNRIIGYIRTSTNRQELGLEVQKKAIEKFSPSIIYAEQISGRKENRSEFQKALDSLGEGDTLLVYNLSRLSRSSRQLVNKNNLKKRIIKLYDKKELSLNEIAMKCNVSVKTVYNVAKKEGLSRK